MFLAELAVELRKSFILVPPQGYLILQLFDKLVLGRQLTVDMGVDATEFSLQSFDTLQSKL